MAIRMPSARSALSLPSAASTSAMNALSVSSRISWVGSTPLRRSTLATLVTKPGVASCRNDTLTAMLNRAGYRLCQSRNWRHACSRTQRPSGSISPDSSASGMNSIGLTSPRCGCCQRSSASTLASRPVCSSITGW